MSLSKYMIRLALASAAMTVGLGSASCSVRNGDLDLTQSSPYWSKDYFNPNDSWYYRATVVDTPPNAGFTSEGDGHWLLLERLRWEITEDKLIGWRDFAAAPGSENEQYEGGQDKYKGTPVAIFTITDHFDIRRNYDPITGEESNVIVQNYDRPWYERQFMRVNWAMNLAPSYQWHIQVHQSGTAFVDIDDEKGNPKRFRFENEYFEVTTRTSLVPDVYSYYGLYGAGYAGDLQSSLIDVRHSFMKVDPNNDYQELPMPATVVLEDENGKEVRDENGYAVRVPIWDRFGIYSTLGRNTWDPDRGSVASNQLFNATRFNIWEKSKNADGSVIPESKRTPKPIVYYSNVEHPKQLLNGSREVARQWSQVFKETVFELDKLNPAGERKFAAFSDVPEMFILKENDCNPANVATVLGGLSAELRAIIKKDAAVVSLDENDADGLRFDGSIESVAERYNLANDPNNNAPFSVRQEMETQALADLERICSATEYYTGVEGDPQDQLPDFKYQRAGDVRYNLMNLVMSDHQAGWLGLGPMLADPLTGETIHAVANVAVAHLDTSTARATQIIDAINGLIPLDDLAFGYDIQSYMTQKLAEAAEITNAQPSQELVREMDRRFRALGQGENLLHEISPNAAKERLQRVAGTSLEQRLVSPDDLKLNHQFDPIAQVQQGDFASVDEAILDQVSPVRNGDLAERYKERQSTIMRMGEHAMDAPEFVDSFVVGLALQYKDLPPRERFEKIRESIYIAVMLHEVGHNVGLFHNFSASTDALNYGERFWELQKLPADLDDAIAVAPDANTLDQLTRCKGALADLRTQAGDASYTVTTQECLRQTESVYSSIMDYHGNWNADASGLGPYDHAAIKFAYGQLLEVFDDGALQVNPEQQDMSRWLFLNDWKKIPDQLTNGVEGMYKRKYVQYDWTATSTQQKPPSNAVPYRFCPGGYYGQLPECRVFDYGPDTRSNTSFLLTRYWQHYFFTHFNRDRLWDYFVGGEQGAINADLQVFDDFTQKMQWYYFFKATDPEFTGSDAEADYLATTITGLNHFSHVLGHPGNGVYTTVNKSQVFGLTNDSPDTDRLAPSDIMVQWSNLFQCDAQNFATIDAQGAPQTAKAGYQLANVPLGDGRPFFLGFTNDYEEYYTRYVGTFWAKQYALLFMGLNTAWFPRTTYAVDPRFFDVSWYRLFPNEIGKIYHDLIVDQQINIGAVVDANGRVIHRDLIDPATGKAPDYTGLSRTIPSISFNHQYYAMLYGQALMSSTLDGAPDFTKTMKLTIDGSDDDLAAFDSANPEDVAVFTHPISGLTIRGLRVGPNPIAYDLVQRLNVLKDRYLRLDACVQDADAGNPVEDTYCFCANSVRSNALGNRQCSAAFLEQPGTGECALYSLRDRRDAASEAMDDFADFIDDARAMNRLFSEW